MITGKPLTISSVGLVPKIVVTATTGSVVTLDGVQGIEVSGTWTFNTTLGTHTVVATWSGRVRTVSVNVDKVAIFPVSIDYKLYLYWLGNEYSGVTGGWSAYNYRTGYYNNALTPTMRKNASSIYGRLQSTVDGGFRGVIMTNRAIDLSHYNSLKMHVVNANGCCSEVETIFALYTSPTKGDGYQHDRMTDFLVGVKSGIIGQTVSKNNITVTVDISGLNASRYIILSFLAFYWYDNWAEITFDKVWLE